MQDVPVEKNDHRLKIEARNPRYSCISSCFIGCYRSTGTRVCACVPCSLIKIIVPHPVCMQELLTDIESN